MHAATQADPHIPVFDLMVPAAERAGTVSISRPPAGSGTLMPQLCSWAAGRLRQANAQCAETAAICISRGCEAVKHSCKRLQLNFLLPLAVPGPKPQARECLTHPWIAHTPASGCSLKPAQLSEWPGMHLGKPMRQHLASCGGATRGASCHPEALGGCWRPHRPADAALRSAAGPLAGWAAWSSCESVGEGARFDPLPALGATCGGRHGQVTRQLP